MKNFQRFYSLFFIVIIAFALNSCKQDGKKDTTEERSSVTISGDTVRINRDEILVQGIRHDHTVVLLVDTENISPGSDPKEYCSFADQNPYEPIVDYTTHVLPGDSIIWIGISSTNHPEDKVSIELINYRSGNNVYGGPRQGVNGIVEGKIREDVYAGQEETYAIHFRVIKEGSPPNTYILDPKILVH
jgi:hypothetical protein